MPPAVFFIKILIAKILLTLGYAGLTIYQPVLLAEISNRHSAVIDQAQKGGDKAEVGPDDKGEGKNQGLPLALEKNFFPRLKTEVSFEPKVSAQSFVILDEKTGRILLDEAANAPRSIGSITKLVTAMVFLKMHPDWEKQITLGLGDGKQGYLYISEGEKAKLKDLFFASMVGSSNNATMALAGSTGLSVEEFVGKMNQEVKNWGLKRTNFVEPTGLDGGNQSTAYETALILERALREEKIKTAVTTKVYLLEVENNQGKKETRKVNNTDELLFLNLKNSPIVSIVGAKTGFIDEAGYCFVMEAANEQKNKIIVVVLGSDSHSSRFSEARTLAEWAFNSYLWPNQEGFDRISAER